METIPGIPPCLFLNEDKCLSSWGEHHSFKSSVAQNCPFGVPLVISLLGMQRQISTPAVWESPEVLVLMRLLSASQFSKEILAFICWLLNFIYLFIFLTILTVPVTVFWEWTTYPSASYVACSAVHRAPARSPPSWPSCPQSPPTASWVMTVAAGGRCTSPSVPTGSTHPERRTPSSVSWHALQEGTALPACLSAAHPAPATRYYSPMETQWTWARWAVSTSAWVPGSTATSSLMTTRATGRVLGNPRRRTCTLM